MARSPSQDPKARAAKPAGLRVEIRALSRLASPIILTNLCWMLVGTVDLIMLGRWNGDEIPGSALAAASLSGVWIYLTQMLGMGLVMGIDPLVTQGHGARDREALGRALQRGLIVALIASIPVVWLRFYTAEFLSMTAWVAETFASRGETAPGAAAGVREALQLGDLERLSEPAENYALAQSFATPFFLVFIALRQQLQGRGILKPALFVALIANGFNALCNQVLIFEFGYGLVGAGVATGLTRAFMAITLILLVRRHRLLRGAWVPWDRESFRWSGIAKTLRYGIPVGLHFAFEVGAFGATTLLAGCLGVVATVAHAAAINLASLTFMIPLGVALAATTRVGNLIGERRREEAQLSAYAALWMGGGVMALLGALLLIGRNHFPHIYLEDPAALALAASVLPIAAAFQVFDGLQVVGSGILRGTGKTVPPAVFNFVAWWVIALPMGAWFVLRRNGSLEHIWWSLVLGLGIVATAMVFWVRYRGPSSFGGEPDLPPGP